MFKKLKLSLLALALSLCFILGACGIDKGLFVKYSIEILNGKYDSVQCVVGENVIAQKNGKTRLFNKNGRAISDKYVGMMYDDEYTEKNYIYAIENYLTITVLDAKTGKKLTKPMMSGEIKGHYLFPVKDFLKVGAVYKKTLQPVQTDGREFVFSDVYDDLNDRSFMAVVQGTPNDLYYFVSGGNVVPLGFIGGDPAVPVQVYPDSDAEMFLVLGKDNTTADLYVDGVNLTNSDFANITAQGAHTVGKDKYMFFKAWKPAAPEDQRYQVFYVKVGAEPQMHTVWNGSADTSVSGLYRNLIHIDNQLKNFITGQNAVASVSEIDTLNPPLTKNGRLYKTAKADYAVMYRKGADNKYYIVDSEGNVLASSPNKIYYYLDGKFIMPFTAASEYKIEETIYTEVYPKGRSLIMATTGGGRYDVYCVSGDGLSLLEKNVVDADVNTNEYDNFEYYIINYLDGEGNAKYFFYANGKASESYAGYTRAQNNDGGAAGRFAAVKVSEKKLLETGKDTETIYGEYMLLDLNTMDFASDLVFNDVESVYTAPEGPQNKAKAVVIASVYQFDADNRRTLDVTAAIFPAAKKAVTIGSGSKSSGEMIFTGTSIAIGEFDFADQKVTIEVYDLDGKKIGTVKKMEIMDATRDIYIENEKSSYVVFEGWNEKLGVMDRKLNVVVKPIYDDIWFTGQGTAGVDREGFHGIINMKGKELVRATHEDIYEHKTYLLTETADPDYWNMHDLNGKLLIKTLYSIDTVAKYTLNADKVTIEYDDYMHIGLTKEKERINYYQVYDGKNIRLLKETVPA